MSTVSVHMKNLFEKYKSYILKNDESNFPDVLSSISYIHEIVCQRYDLALSKFIPKNDALFVSKGESQIPQYGRDRKEVLKEAVGAFDYLPRWQHPSVLHNITPSPLFDSVAIRTLVNLYNPNCLWDFVSGSIVTYEKIIIRQIAELMGWKEANDAAGIFTFGGKATLIYALKMGINNCSPESTDLGIKGNEIVTISSEAGHYSMEYVSNLLGLGKKGCIRISNDNSGSIDLAVFRSTVESTILNGKKIACVVLSAGNSLDNTVDRIREVREIVDELVTRHNLEYTPHIHADSVIGWAWLFFRQYDFEKNVLALDVNVLEKIQSMYKKVHEIEYADSAGVDFHKNGFSPYITSLFLTKKTQNLYSLNSQKSVDSINKAYGENFLQHHSIEHSRGGEGILSAWVVLQELGVDGFQRYIAQMVQTAEYIRNNLNSEDFQVLNPQGLGFAIVLFPSLPFLNKTQNENTEVDSKIFKHAQNYCQKFFESSSLQLEGTKNPIVGYIPSYTNIKNGRVVPAIKLYPMVPFYDEHQIKTILQNLSDFKKKFDEGLIFSKVDFITQKETDIIYPK